jgi:hypothetical protein
VDDTGEEDPVAIPQRQIEPPFVSERRDHVRVVRGDVAKLGQHGIAGHHVGDQEYRKRGQQHHQRGNNETGGKVAQHRRTIADRTVPAKLCPHAARL